MGVTAVIFDLDLTLWFVERQPDWEAITAHQSMEIDADFGRLGLERLDRAEFIRRFWIKFDAADGSLRRQHEERRWSQGPGIIRENLAEYEVECPNEEAACIWEAINRVPLRHFNVRLFNDANETVRVLRAAGYRLAIVTGRPLPSAIVSPEMRDQGLPDAFEAVVTAGDLGYRKPHRLLLETVLQRLRVQPDESMVVGDSYEEDIVPASELGAVPVLKLNDREPDPSWVLARYKVPSLAALLELDELSR